MSSHNGYLMGIGDKLFIIPLEAFKFGQHGHDYTLDVDKTILEKAEGFDKDDWPVTCEQLANSTREWLANIYTCYGCKPYWQTEVLEQTEKERSGETESKRMTRIEKKADPKKEEMEEGKVEPIHPSENRGGKKRGLLDTCK